MTPQKKDETTERVYKGSSPFWMGIGTAVGIILCGVLVYTTQLIARQPLVEQNKQLLSRVERLERENQELRATRTKPTPPTELPVLQHEEDIRPKVTDEFALKTPRSTIPGSSMRALVVYVGEYSLAKLPDIKHMLYVLKARGSHATFVFATTTRQLKIMRQIERYGHEIGFEDTAPNWAPATAPLITSVHSKSVRTNHPYVDYQVRIDAPGQTTQELTDSFLRTNPGQIILVDPERNSNSSQALSRALKNIQLATVGEFLNSPASIRRESGTGTISMAAQPGPR